MPDEQGVFADAARAREQQLVRQLAAAADLDRSFEGIVRGAQQYNLQSRRRLDAIEAEVTHAAAGWPALDTPAGSRQFQSYLTGKTREVHQIVAAAATDSRQRTAQVQALTGRYPIGADLPADLPAGDDTTDPQIDGDGNVDGIPEQTHDDLGASIPGTGIRLGGDGDPRDGHSGYPQLHIPGGYDGDNPLPVRRDADGSPLERPLPTGTAIGPGGEQYGFFAMVPYDQHGFTSPNTVVVDLANPGKVIGRLDGVSRASGAFDAATGRMVVVGNTVAGQRAMWTSEPVAQQPDWIRSVNAAQPRAFTGAMNGDRENQLVPLPNGGGFLLAGATDGGPVQAVAAATPDGLFTARPRVVAGQIPDEAGPGWPYGPTVTDLRYRPEIRQWESHLRVSTWTGGAANYNPKTYDVTLTGTE